MSYRKAPNYPDSSNTSERHKKFSKCSRHESPSVSASPRSELGYNMPGRYLAINWNICNVVVFMYNLLQNTAQNMVPKKLLPKEAASQVCSLHAGHRGQRQLRTHITDGIDAGHRGAVLVIHLHTAILLQLHSNLQTQQPPICHAVSPFDFYWYCNLVLLPELDDQRQKQLQAAAVVFLLTTDLQLISGAGLSVCLLIIS